MKSYLYLLIPIIFVACVGLRDASLTVEEPLAQLDSAEVNAPALPVMEYNNGIFYNKNSPIYRWEVSHSNIGLQRLDGNLTVNLKNVGKDWEMLTLKFAPIDFTETPVLLVKATCTGTDSAKVRIDLVDEDGLSTNFKPQENYIRLGEIKEYKFDFADKWIMNWPYRADVNPKRIVEIKFNFNGGGPNYSGRVHIEEIKAVPQGT